MLRRVPYLPPRWAVLLDGAVTGIAVGVSLYIENPERSIVTGLGVPVGWTLIGVAFLISSFVSYVTEYQEVVRVREDTERTFLEIALEQLLFKYQDEIAHCEMRANVMLVEKQWQFSLPPCRESYLSFEETHGNYTEAELEQVYGRGTGCAGTALANNNPTYYDSEERDGLSQSLTHTQEEITSHVKSILSVPIYPDNDTSRTPIGVLSVDSTENIHVSKLHEEPAQRLIMKYAGAIGDVVS